MTKVQPQDLKGGIKIPGNNKVYGTDNSGNLGFFDKTDNNSNTSTSFGTFFRKIVDNLPEPGTRTFTFTEDVKTIIVEGSYNDRCSHSWEGTIVDGVKNSVTFKTRNQNNPDGSYGMTVSCDFSTKTITCTTRGYYDYPRVLLYLFG